MFDRQSLKSVARIGAAALLSASIGACGNMPRPMSSLSEVPQASQQGNINLVQLTAANLPSAPKPTEQGFPLEFTQADEIPYNHLGPGDRLQIRVIESGTPTAKPPIMRRERRNITTQF